MNEQEDLALNAKAILLAVGGAAVAGLLFVLARSKDEESPTEQVSAAVEHVEKKARKAAKEAKKQRKALSDLATRKGDQVAEGARDLAATVSIDAKAAERALKAAAWDAQQEAREAEGKLRAAGHRVVDDATQFASWVGAETRHLAGEGRDRIASLRHREGDARAPEIELERLRAEIDELRAQLGARGRRAERDYSRIASKLAAKGGPMAGVMSTPAAAAALAELERSLKAKAPALLAARNRTQLLEILQQELGPTLRNTAIQAASAALGKWDAARDEVEAPRPWREHAKDVIDEVKDTARHSRDEAFAEARSAAEKAREAAHEAAEAIHRDSADRTNGKRHFWNPRDIRHDEDAAVDAGPENPTQIATSPEEEEHRSKAGLFWGGAGLGLALYALLDADRREHVLRLANEASIQVQELVRDLQGYDDEF